MYVRVCVCMLVHVYVDVHVNMHSYIYTCISNSAFTLAPGRHTPFTSTTVPKGVCAPSRCSTLARARCKGSYPSSSSGSCSFSRASCHSGDAFTRRRKCSRTSKATCSASPPRPSRKVALSIPVVLRCVQPSDQKRQGAATLAPRAVGCAVYMARQRSPLMGLACAVGIETGGCRVPDDRAQQFAGHIVVHWPGIVPTASRLRRGRFGLGLGLGLPLRNLPGVTIRRTLRLAQAADAADIAFRV